MDALPDNGKADADYWRASFHARGCASNRGVMEMKFDENKLYVVEGRTLGFILRVMDRLYANDSRRIDADKSRTLAHGLYAHLTQNVEEFKSK